MYIYGQKNFLGDFYDFYNTAQIALGNIFERNCVQTHL